MVADQEIITSPFHLVGEDATRQDLAVRRETKYIFPHADVGKFRSLLEGNARRLIHNESISTVRSIYFDNVILDDCQANLDGISPRKKVRIRWYDSLMPNNVIFYEIKWRDNRATGKHRLELRLQQEVDRLTYRQIVDNLVDILPPQYVPDILRRSEPIVLVEYKREHFASIDKSLRVTLDYDLKFYDQTGKRFISTSFPCRTPEMFVVEVKGPQAYHTEVKELLHPFAPRARACSKYVHGCRQLGLVPPRNYH